MRTSPRDRGDGVILVLLLFARRWLAAPHLGR